MEQDLKIVVDSNILISAALAIQSNRPNSPSFALFTKITTREIIAVASPQMLYGLAGKLEKSDFQFPASFKLSFVKLIADAVDMISIRGLNMGCRDERDNIFIETAINGRVDALVTRDLDLQETKIRYSLAKRACRVLDVSELLAYLRDPSAEFQKSLNMRATNPCE